MFGNTSVFAVRSHALNFTAASNLSGVSFRGPDWGFVAIYNLIVTIVSFLANGSVMALLLVNPSLRTPFNIYLMNLVSANFVFACVVSPAAIINNLYSGWWLALGYCSFLIYCQKVLESGIRVLHSLITLNRVWAIFWPLSYRRHHKVRTVYQICAFAWLFVLANVLPGLLLDYSYYRLPTVINGTAVPCGLNTRAQWSWVLTTQLEFSDLTTLVMIVAYPVIW